MNQKLVETSQAIGFDKRQEVLLRYDKTEALRGASTPKGSIHFKAKTTDTSISLHDLFAQIEKEFFVDEQGHGFVSRRGIARLVGTDLKSIQRTLKKLIEGDGKKLHFLFEPFAGQEFSPTARIPDTLVVAIIKYYAYQNKEQAQLIDAALGAVGLRTVIQKTLGWEPQPKLTDRQIVELLCLPVPTKWQPRFSVEFYNELQRLTGLTPIGHKRPALWAKITKELVYAYLPTGVYEEIKCWQQATDPHKKLHQYLSEEGIEMLGEHLRRVITLMQCAAHLSEVELLVNQSLTKNYQLNLFA